MDEERRRPGRRERRRDLAADVPLLPIPITTTRPRQARIARSAATKPSPCRPSAHRCARASMSSVARASSSARSASKEGEGGTVIAKASSRIGRF
jgi:hypothetical protein